MPQDYLTTYLGPASVQTYQKVTKAYPGVMGLRTSLTDPNSKKLPYEVFQNAYDAFVKKAGKDARGDLLGKSKSQDAPIIKTLHWLYDTKTPGPPNTNKQDYCTNVGEQLETLRSEIDAAVTKNSELASSDELAELLNLSVALTIRVIGETENLGKPQSEMPAATIAEVAARHCAATVYDLVGDPTRNYLIGAGETPGSYTKAVANGFGFKVPLSKDDRAALDLKNVTDPKNPSVGACLRELGESFDNGVANADPPVAAANRLAELNRFAILADVVAKEAISAANYVAKSKKERDPARSSGEGAALCAILAQTLRPAFGLKAEGKGRTLTDTTRSDLITLEKSKAADIAKRELGQPEEGGPDGKKK